MPPREVYPVPEERPEKLQGPEVGALVLIHSKYDMFDGLVGRIIERSYVWGPGDPAYSGGMRRYDWKVVEYQPGRRVVFDDYELTPIVVGMSIREGGWSAPS